MVLETIQVKFKNGKFDGKWVTINASDFDSSLHTKEGVKEEPKAEQKVTKGRPKKNNIQAYVPNVDSKWNGFDNHDTR